MTSSWYCPIPDENVHFHRVQEMKLNVLAMNGKQTVCAQQAHLTKLCMFAKQKNRPFKYLTKGRQMFKNKFAKYAK